MVEERFRNSRGPFRGLEISRERDEKERASFEEDENSTRRIFGEYGTKNGTRENTFNEKILNFGRKIIFSLRTIGRRKYAVL